VSSVARFAWATLCFNVAVVLWGAFVRATGSGAGCGNKWPSCSGSVLGTSANGRASLEHSYARSGRVAAPSHRIAGAQWDPKAQHEGLKLIDGVAVFGQYKFKTDPDHLPRQVRQRGRSLISALTTSTEGEFCLLVPFSQTTKFQALANRGTLAQHQPAFMIG